MYRWWRTRFSHERFSWQRPRAARPSACTCSHFPRCTCQVRGVCDSIGGRAGRAPRLSRGRPGTVGALWPGFIGRPPGPSANRERRDGRRRPARDRPSDPSASAFPGIFRVRPVVRRSAAVSPIERVYARSSAAAAAEAAGPTWYV